MRIKKSKKTWVCFLAIWLVAGCSTVPITGRKQLMLVSQPELLALSLESYRNFIRKSKLCHDSKKVAMVQRVGKRIAKAAEEFMRQRGKENCIKDFHWEFNLIDDDKTVNAFAMPGGKIVVYTGILPVAKNDNGLATVLSHEVAHVLANHSGERLSQLLLVQLGGATLSTAMKNKKTQTQYWAQVAYGMGTSLGVLLPYSRTHEKEADHIGLILMAQAGYDPREAVAFWERLLHQSHNRPPEFLSTHPAPQTRIEAIKKEIPEAMKYYKPMAQSDF